MAEGKFEGRKGNFEGINEQNPFNDQNLLTKVALYVRGDW
jgi:hypothetical protein